MLGPFAAVLDYFSANPETLSLILLIWAVIYFLGLVQLKRIESKTTSLVLEHSLPLLQAEPELTPVDLYERIYPVWITELKGWKYLFIPHKHDLWPVSVTLEHVLAKIPFSSEWISKILTKNGIELS
jgi:hypothetical protein